MENLISTWQNLPQQIDPVALTLGGFEIRWYGLMYLAAFLCAYLAARWRIKNEKEFLKYSPDFITDLFTWMILGLLIGARVGYILFYKFSYFLSNPLEAFMPFSFENGFEFTGIAGMSYHGGVIGVLIAGWIFVKLKKENFWELVDLVVPAIPLGYTFGRIGNFLNGELWGRTTDLSIGMYFPRSAQTIEGTQEIMLRHPSQLYEAFFEGIVLFIILWSLRNFTKKKLPEGSMLALYLIGYGIFRFFIEYVREPDAHLGFVLFEFSMGQVLCLGMILLAVIITFGLKRTHAKN